MTALLAAELGLRAMRAALPPPPSLPASSVYLYYEDPNGLMLPKPGWVGPTGTAMRVINADGYRDRRYPLRPTRFRVAFLGDSFTMGDGVPLEDTFPKLFESALLADGYEIEAINFGLTATNTLNQVAFLRYKVIDYEPDLVVLAFNLNDAPLSAKTRFQSLAEGGSQFLVRLDGEVVLLPPASSSLLSRVVDWCRARSYLCRAAYAARRELRARTAGRQGGPRPYTFDDRVIHSVRDGSYLRAIDAIAEANQLLIDRGKKFLVVVLPAMTDVDYNSMPTFSDYPFFPEHAAVLQQLGRRGILAADLTPSLASEVPRRLTVSRTDPHFNRTGNRRIASLIREIVEERFGTLPKTSHRDADASAAASRTIGP